MYHNVISYNILQAAQTPTSTSNHLPHMKGISHSTSLASLDESVVKFNP
jgi:hypothetical protein